MPSKPLVHSLTGVMKDKLPKGRMKLSPVDQFHLQPVETANGSDVTKVQPVECNCKHFILQYSRAFNKGWGPGI